MAQQALGPNSEMLALVVDPPATSNASLWKIWWTKWCASYD